MSCNFSKDGDYNDYVKKIPKRFRSWFPAYQNFKNLDYYSADLHLHTKGQPFLATYSVKTTTNEIDSLIRSDIKKVDCDDFVTVNYPANKDNWYKLPGINKKFKVNENVTNETVPLPNFYSSKYHSKNTCTGLESNFQLYVKDFEFRKVLSDEHHQCSCYMKEGFTDGWSKGLAINHDEQIIIYWLLIW
jgi:hypothetical protein